MTKPEVQGDFARPYALQFRGSALARWVLRRFGWQIEFEGFPALQGIVAVYPHTSNWDFIVMVLVKWAIGVPASFWGKDALFRVPLLGAWMRWLGGIPVERTSAHGVVGQAVKMFQEHQAQGKYLWLGLAPEGTRKAIPGWRSGFYRVAVQAEVPLGIGRLDYGTRTVRMVDFFRLTGDEAHDMARIAKCLAGVRGLHPENAAPIQLLAAHVPRSETIVR